MPKGIEIILHLTAPVSGENQILRDYENSTLSLQEEHRGPVRYGALQHSYCKFLRQVQRRQRAPSVRQAGNSLWGFFTSSLELKRVQHLRKDLQGAQVSIYDCEIISFLLTHTGRSEQSMLEGGYFAGFHSFYQADC